MGELSHGIIFTFTHVLRAYADFIKHMPLKKNSKCGLLGHHISDHI